MAAAVPWLAVDRLAAIAKAVVVLDVVVDQRSLMKDLHGHRHALNGVGDLGHVLGAPFAAGATAGQRVVRRQRDERPKMFAAANKEIPRDGFGGVKRGGARSSGLGARD